MRFSSYFAPTLKEAPSEAEIISHKLLIRAGMIRKTAAGIYSFLPLGKRVLAKIENIVREEMDATGAQEVLMPVLQPRDLWEKSGRWGDYGPEMMRLEDRAGRDFALGPTHEELITTLVSNEIRSYKELPQTFYQIQVKFRDEIRPRFGLMRGREFIMKDAYSFHASQQSLEETYQAMSKAYANIVQRCGLGYKSVEADSGLIGGKVSEEFMVLAGSGEDAIAMCGKCHYASNLEQAKTRIEAPEKNKPLKMEKVATPGKVTVEEVSETLKVTPLQVAKTLVYLCDGKPVMAVVRGDREVVENKVARAAGCKEIRLFTDEDFEAFPELVKGFVGPTGNPAKIIIDEEVAHMANFVTGANEKDAHFINTNPDRDFKADITTDIKQARSGDYCPSCDGSLETTRGIEIGHIFQLGTKYSKALGAEYLDADGKSHPMVMGCYGIGVTRLLAATVEQNNDERGMIWPKNIAPYSVSIIQLDKEASQAAEDIYSALNSNGIDTAWDDRDERAGVKFADNELIGFPVTIVVGKKAAEGIIEVKVRSTGDKKEIPIKDCLKEVEKTLQGLS